ncbi:MAG: hypothetical protein AB8B58_17885 [Roseobacter sp.]
MKLVGIVFMGLLVLSGCNEDQFEQIGYFKGGNNNRVFLLQATVAVSEAEVSERAARLMHTDGRMTIAFIAEHNVIGVADLVTLAGDFQAANGAMLEKPTLWRWWYRRSPNGDETLVDCNLSASTVCQGV